MASTYGSGLRARLLQASEKSFGAPSFRMSEDHAEKIYKQKLYGASKKPEVCQACNIAKAANGCCGC